MNACGTFVLLELLELPGTNGIIIPDNVQRPCDYGKILSAGPESNLKEGDIACFFLQKTVRVPASPGSRKPIILIDSDGVFATIPASEAKGLVPAKSVHDKLVAVPSDIMQ